MLPRAPLHGVAAHDPGSEVDPVAYPPGVDWELVPRRGITNGDQELFLGTDRSAARSAMSALYGEPTSHFPDEDDFRSDAEGTWIRLRFDEGDRLQDVEFLRGRLSLAGTRLHAGARWAALRQELAAKGYTFEPAATLGDGAECTALGVNIATHEDVGGQGDGIEWVIVAAGIA
jgi:hypothetical protein